MASLPNGIELTDFTNFPLADLGRTVKHIPITKQINNITGEETLTEGTQTDITAIVMRINKKWTFDKEGKIEGGDAYIMTAPDVSISEQDRIIADGIKYTIKNLITIYVRDTPFFKYGNLFIVDNG